MRTKLVLWGTQGEEEKVLIALSLNAEENKIDVWTFPEKVATEDFYNKMMQDWRFNREVAFPEGVNHQERELSITDSLLPDELRVEKGDLIQRAKTEWHFIVLSSKLNSAYRNELEELKGKVEKLETYSQESWDDLKEFWNKVQEQVREENLFREHANALRDDINGLFTNLKSLRSKMDDEFRSRSKEHKEKFMTSLEEVEKKITGGMRLQNIFEELKQLQRRFRDTKFTRDHRSQVWERLDKNFKEVKAKRFGDQAIVNKSPNQRFQRRLDGLLTAIEKMKRSIQYDKNDLDFQKKKIETTDGQLEAQIRQAKIKMIESRITSKEDKLKEMLVTKVELESKVEKQKERESRRQEKEEREKAKAAAAEKIKSKIAAEVEARKQEAEGKEESIFSAVSATLVESLEDVLDTVKAVASVVGDKIGDAVEELKDKASEAAAGAAEVVDNIVEEVKEETAEAVEKAKAIKEDIKEETKEMVAEIKEETAEVVEKAKAIQEDVKEEVAEISEKVKEKATEVKAAAEEKLAEAKEEVAEVVDKVKESTDSKEEVA